MSIKILSKLANQYETHFHSDCEWMTVKKKIGKFYVNQTRRMTKMNAKFFAWTKTKFGHKKPLWMKVIASKNLVGTVFPFGSKFIQMNISLTLSPNVELLYAEAQCWKILLIDIKGNRSKLWIQSAIVSLV